AELAVPSSGLRFWRCLRASSPAAALLPLWLVIWSLAALILAVGELLYFAVGGVIAAAGGVVESLLSAVGRGPR
ncbi:MAG TPA: hypothetical protein VGE98_12965, partial [Thermoanaerobaculia bacterium]